MLTLRTWAAGCLLLPLAVGCGKPMTPDEMDLAAPPDMATVDKDLKAEDDLAKPPDDLSPVDKPMLTGLPNCIDLPIKAEALYEKTYKANCNAMGCHRGITKASELVAAWVGKDAMGTTAIQLVKPGDLHQSYVMYKLMGQHMNPLINGKGVSMPKGGARLSDEHLCNFINWIKGGAG